MAYKKLIKVSNVCQLFIPDDTHTVAGVTIANNRDGSLTIDGTGTDSGGYTNFTSLGKNDIQYKIGDKLFVSVYVISGTCSNLYVGFSQTGAPAIEIKNPVEGTYYSGGIAEKDIHKSNEFLGFYVGNNTFNNLRVKFNIINLTETYGAGHEPTTVEQFRQDFPEEMYDYSPHCWLTSYKRVIVTGNETYPTLTAYRRNLTCKTKNLWTCDKTMSYAIYNSGTQVFKVINTGSSSCYTLPTPIPAGTTLTITVYCLSGFTKDEVTIGGYHLETGNSSWQCHCRLPSNIDLSGKSFSSTRTTTNTLTDFWIFVYASKPDNLQFKVQLELGNTSTDYVPYGHL